MADVIALFKAMADSPDVDIEKLKADVTAKIPYGEFKIEVKEVAFGLKALEITIKVTGEQGIDPVIDAIKSVEHVASVELEQVGNV